MNSISPEMSVGFYGGPLSCTGVVKSLTSKWIVAGLALCITGRVFASLAQMPGINNPLGLTSVLRKLISDMAITNDFVATAQFTINDATGKELLYLEIPMWWAGKKLRCDVDIRKIRASGNPASSEDIAACVSNGTDKGVVISGPNPNTGYLLYPSVKGYCVFEEPPVSTETTTRVDRMAIGTDHVDGHPCTKHSMLRRFADHEWEGTVWKATDLNGFPIQIHCGRWFLRFTEIRLQKPQDSLFGPPVGYEHILNCAPPN